MNLFESFAFDVTKCKSLIPPGREHIKRDLAADRIREPIVGEVLFQSLDKLLTDTVFLKHEKTREFVEIDDMDNAPCRISRNRGVLGF